LHPDPTDGPLSSHKCLSPHKLFDRNISKLPPIFFISTIVNERAPRVATYRPAGNRENRCQRAGVGKNCIIERAVHGCFKVNLFATVGATNASVRGPSGIDSRAAAVVSNVWKTPPGRKSTTAPRRFPLE
jgi:hypothetical protein